MKWFWTKTSLLTIVLVVAFIAYYRRSGNVFFIYLIGAFLLVEIPVLYMLEKKKQQNGN